MSNAGEVLDRLQVVLGVSSDSALARPLGVGVSTPASWRNRNSIPFDECMQVALERGVSLDYLILGRGTWPPQEVDLRDEDVAWTLTRGDFAEIASRARKYASESLSVEAALDLVRSGAYVWVPYYDIPLAGGAGREFLTTPKKWNFYRREYFDGRPELSIIDLAEFPVAGISMYPELQAKDTVMVDRSKKTVGEGDMYALRTDSLLMVKYLQMLPNGRIQATSKLSEEFPPFEIIPADLESGHSEIIGRVVRQGRDR
nr:helix-turn-helix domain-containing protein [Stagnimonas aquatica]